MVHSTAQQLHDGSSTLRLHQGVQGAVLQHADPLSSRQGAWGQTRQPLVHHAPGRIEVQGVHCAQVRDGCQSQALDCIIWIVHCSLQPTAVGKKEAMRKP